MLDSYRNLRAGSTITYIVILCFFFIVVGLKQTGVIENLESWISSKRVVSVDNHGAKGDGVSDDTKAFKDAWEVVCSMPSRPILKVPQGKIYLIGPIDFGGPCLSEVTLMISGAIIAPKEPRVWDGLNPRKWLYFHGVDYLVVKGGGIINGMGKKWWACKLDIRNPCRHAPTAITFHRCNHLNISNLTIRDSQQIHLAFTSCNGVKVSHLEVIAPRDSPNTDGIHISESTWVEVKNTIVGTGDDCISIVSNSSRVGIINLICGPGHGISIGSLGEHNSSSQVHDILIDGAFISNTQNGLRIKTWQGGSGFVKDVNFQNVWMNGVSNPIIIDQYYCPSSLPCPNQTLSIKVERISYRSIHGTSTTPTAIKFACSDRFSCEKIILTDIQLFYNGGNASAYCWNAFGFSSGRVNPLPCFPSDDHYLQQNVLFPLFNSQDVPS
ncbi:probable polygalacturonase At1g80170 [Aristolochia californica]|uniref:probable polygalacturonase At1g80170 n=1 Tax=Aristolochia californica TaxID=171875 RepID=UPI0035DC131E